MIVDTRVGNLFESFAQCAGLASPAQCGQDGLTELTPIEAVMFFRTAQRKETAYWKELQDLQRNKV